MSEGVPRHRKKAPGSRGPVSADEGAVGRLCRRSLFSIISVTNNQAKSSACLSKRRFSQAKSLHPRLTSQLTKAGLTHFTPIQLAAYPVLTKGANALIRSFTGSGKTLAYMVPLFNCLVQSSPPLNRSSGTKMLVLAPTRELAHQILQNILLLSPAAVGLVAGALTGGEDTKKEKERLRKGLVIVVGTPGRILYHLQNTHNFSLRGLQYLVVDECDRVLDLGFRKPVEEIANSFSESKADVQKVFLAASPTQKVEQMIASLTADDGKELTRLGFSQNMEELVVPQQLSHFFATVDEQEKPEFLLKLLVSMWREKCIVFFSTADQVNFFTDLCSSLASPFEENVVFSPAPIKIHGYMQHKERKAVYADFASRQTGVLFTTDVGSRGLDFAGVKLVVLYDPPAAMADYVNRVGRTARMFAAGAALSLLFDGEEEYARRLVSTFKAEEISKEKVSALVVPCRWDLQIRHTVEAHNLNHAARRAFVSFCRAYSLLGDRQCFNLKALNLHKIARGFGLESAHSKARTGDAGYVAPKDSKQISRSEQSHIDTKRRTALAGIKKTARSDYLNMEFM